MHKMYSCLFVPNFSTVLASTAGSCRAALAASLAFPWHPQGTEGTSCTQHLNLHFQRDLQLPSGAWEKRRGERVSAGGTAHPIPSLPFPGFPGPPAGSSLSAPGLPFFMLLQYKQPRLRVNVSSH